MSDERSLLHVYEAVLTRFRERGIAFAIMGGQALMRLGFVNWTKDLDLAIRPWSLADARTAIAGVADPAAFRYRAMSAPLADPWMASGWSCHLELPLPDGGNARLDLVTRPPRVPAFSIDAADLLPADELADSKMTQRSDKDWAMVTLLGSTLIERGRPAGFRHIFDAVALTEALHVQRPSDAILEERPALRLALAHGSITAIQFALDTEREFWRALDRLRVGLFQTALMPFTRLVREQRLDEVTFAAAHDRMEALAAGVLPRDPIGDHGLARLVAEAREAALFGRVAEAAQWLPPSHLVVARLQPARS